jgi:branched-chain amino acid transport system ATP-binding protein
MLEAKDLAVAYGQARALDGVSLSVSAGELVCAVGPNGAGKSTLINTIAGLLPLTSGTLLFDGVDLATLPAHRFIAAGIAVVPEGRRLFTRMSVRENLEMGSLIEAARRERQASIAQMCELFPALSARLDVPAGALSGGQQQMVAIARALMARPRLLLLDEPSLGLSPLIVAEMFALIRAIHAQGVTILMVEQNVARALEVATRAFVLEEGRIVMEGDRDTLLADPVLRRAYLGAPGAEI